MRKISNRSGMFWILVVIAVIAVAMLAGCTDRREAPKKPTDIYIIKDDGGGQVLSAVADRKRLKAWGGQVRIEGYCNSACTIFASLPNACLAPGSRYGFHSVTIAGQEAPPLNDVLADFYRGQIKEQFRKEWSKSTKLHRVTAEEFVKLDPEAKLCEEAR